MSLNGSGTGANLHRWIAMAVLAGSMVGCAKPKTMDASAAAKAKALAGIPVVVKPAVQGDITQTLEVTGALAAQNDVVVGARLAGRVATVLVREGDSVAAGQVVATMELVDFRSQVLSAEAGLQSALSREQQARLALQQATTTARQAETTLAMTRRTTATGLQVAQATLEAAQARLAVVKQGARPQERRQVEEQVRAAKANCDRAQADLARYKDLLKDQAISQSLYDQAKSVAEAAEAGYAGARESLDLIREGARVEDIRQAELAVAQAREGVARAQADSDAVILRENDVENAHAAAKAAQQGLSSAQSSVVQARAALAISRTSQSDASIKSPIAGYVAARLAEPGQQVGSGAGVLRVVQPGSVYLKAMVSESQYSGVTPGQSAEVTVDALPGRTFRGTVRHVLPVASSAARNFTVRIDFAADPALRPEMFARATILQNTKRGVTLVPKDSVVYDSATGAARLFVADGGGKAEERKVTLGYVNTTQVMIADGVKPGEKVIVAGQDALQDGDRVQVR